MTALSFLSSRIADPLPAVIERRDGVAGDRDQIPTGAETRLRGRRADRPRWTIGRPLSVITIGAPGRST
jgi:hypothetical protein